MKSLWNSFKIAFAMFSKIPVPQADWSKENMKYMFCFFPFIGAVIGAASLLVARAGWYFGFGNGFLTMVLVMVPVVITGGIHVDGLLDTSDALSSWRDREKRLEILKDSHAGAFAVITACVYFMAFYGGYSQISDNWQAICIMALGFCMSRSSGAYYIDHLSDFSFWRSSVHPAGMGRSCLCDSRSCVFVLQIQSHEIFWRDNRRSFRILPLSLRSLDGSGAGSGNHCISGIKEEDYGNDHRWCFSG